jgi:hypothetical protein
VARDFFKLTTQSAFRRVQKGEDFRGEQEMKTVALGAILLGAVGDRIDEIKWIPAKQAFEKASDQQSRRWVLIYKEWPR